MRKEIKENMEARIASLQEKLKEDATSNERYVNAEIGKIKVEAQEESDRLDMVKDSEAAWNLYQSYIKVGFTEEQAWQLVQIVLINATKRTLF